MEEGSSKKRKDYRNMHTKHEQEKKKQKKKEQRQQSDASSMPSSSRDCAVLKLKRKEKKPNIFGGEVPWKERELKNEGAFAEEGVSVRTEQVFEAKTKAKNIAHSLCKLKVRNLAQEDGSHHVHVDRNGFCDWTKREPKKVRFSDQLAPCKCEQNVSEEVCTRNSHVSKESLANGCAGTVSCRCNKDNTKEVPPQDESMSSNARTATDEKSLFTRKRQKDEDDEIWGKRFTPEEDELLKNALLEYIKVKGWEEKEGIDKVLNCSKHKEAHNCWGVIRLSLPHRPRRAVRLRAYLLFEEGTHLGRWSKKEEELLKRLHKEHGSQWKSLSTLIGRSQYSISGKWRCLKRPNPTGVWAWDEMQRLSDLVHKYLWLKALGGMQNEKSSRKFLRDNISWDEIADAMGTHSHASCCTKWYRNMSSSMVIDGLWASEDDCLLLKSLLESGACTEEEVEWHRLLNHRSGQTCLVRWKQMVKYLGENRTREFLEKLDSLVRRYAPELLSHESATS